jgi:hypothetical protein
MLRTIVPVAVAMELKDGSAQLKRLGTYQIDSNVQSMSSVQSSAYSGERTLTTILPLSINSTLNSSGDEETLPSNPEEQAGIFQEMTRGSRPVVATPSKEREVEVTVRTEESGDGSVSLREASSTVKIN